MLRMRKPGNSEAEPASWRKIVRWPAFLLANVALLFIIGVSTVRETYRGWSVDREISALESQAVALESGKSKLETLALELASPERVEYEARARLGRKKSGERVIVLEGFTNATWSSDQEADIVGDEVSNINEQASNPARWWAYFFAK